MALDQITITGKIVTAGGDAVQNAVVRLSPAPLSVDSPVAMQGAGVVLDPVEVLTLVDGTFVMNALQGFSYKLEIPSIGLMEGFVAPLVSTITFDVLGLVPLVVSAKDYVDDDGDAHVIVDVAVDRIETVLQRFDELIVQSAPDLGGPWLNVANDPILLLGGIDRYQITDDAPNAYYRAFFASSVSADEGMLSEPILGTLFQESLVISIDEFQKVYLFGLDLTGDDGSPYPKIMYEWYIKAATKWLEHYLDITILATDIVDEIQDHYAIDWSKWGYFQLQNYPVQHVDRVLLQLPSMTSGVSFDLSWVVLEENGAHGVIQIVPGQGSIADILLYPGYLLPTLSLSFGRVPGAWHFDYRCGWEPNDIPYDIKHVVGMVASLGVMNVAGDLVGGSGLQGWSVGLPGLSQSVTTTNSSTNAGFGARIIQYKQDVKQMLPALRDFYGKRMKMVVA